MLLYKFNILHINVLLCDTLSITLFVSYYLIIVK